jgi:hypothetical protein
VSDHGLDLQASFIKGRRYVSRQSHYRQGGRGVDGSGNLGEELVDVLVQVNPRGGDANLEKVFEVCAGRSLLFCEKTIDVA